jgi:hypothetical protein
MTDGGKIITSYSAGTEGWRSDPLDLSINALPLIGELARMLEGAVVRHCRIHSLLYLLQLRKLRLQS